MADSIAGGDQWLWFQTIRCQRQQAACSVKLGGEKLQEADVSKDDHFVVDRSVFMKQQVVFLLRHFAILFDANCASTDQ
jgi:hypothetical protein